MYGIVVPSISWLKNSFRKLKHINILKGQLLKEPLVQMHVSSTCIYFYSFDTRTIPSIDRLQLLGVSHAKKLEKCRA